MQRKYKHNHTDKWHTCLRGKPPQHKEGKTMGVYQPVRARFTMRHLHTESSLEHLEVTTHFTSFPARNNTINGDQTLLAATQTIVKTTPGVHAHRTIPSTRQLSGTTS
jgi:hypothetical protein